MLKDDHILILNQVFESTKTKIKSPEKNFFIIKLGLSLGIYTFLFLNSLYDIASPDYVPECFRDEMQEKTLFINEFLAENPFYRNLLIIVASLLMDITVFVLAVREVLFGKNYKRFFILVIFYGFRAFLQSVFFLKFPTNYIWGNPGVFSIVVPYQPANDFFYSGHLGLCVISFITFKRDGKKFLTYFAVVTAFVEFFTLLVTRAHFFVDLVIGMIVAHYIYIVMDWIYEYLDKREKASRKRFKSKEINLTQALQGESSFVTSSKKKQKKLARSN